jgi:poly-gamma-glutamate synthesis protein (capsule biosynthesis protein)
MKYGIFFFLLFFPWLLSAQDTLKLSVLFTGDIMQHETQIMSAFDPASGRYDYKHCFQYLKPVLSAPDLTIGNLEFTLGGMPYKGYPQFSAPDEILEALKDAGFDVLVTANNHSVDRGKKGLERTITMLDSAKLLHTGTFKDTVDWLNDYPLILESKGFRLSLLNYTYGTNGIRVVKPTIVNHIDTARIRNDLQKAKGQHPDAIIVFMHWGLEYQSMPSVAQKTVAEFCLKNGAKIVIGSHPHVLQPMEWRQDKDQFVAYSLGNFVSAQWERYRNGGAMVHLDMEKIKQGDSTSIVRIKDVRYSLEWVYRSPVGRRTYHVLPVEEFENDSTLIGKSARQTLRQFRDDAHSLYGKENRNVQEWHRPPLGFPSKDY